MVRTLDSWMVNEDIFLVISIWWFHDRGFLLPGANYIIYQLVRPRGGLKLDNSNK